MTDINQQIEAAPMTDPLVRSKLHTLRAWGYRGYVDDVLLAVMAAVTKHYCATLLSDGLSIHDVNQRLPAFIKDVEAQRQQIINDVMRWLDEPDASTLQ